MRILSVIALFLPLTIASQNAAAAQDIMGTWSRGDGNARVSVVRCGQSYCATNIWIRDGTAGEKVGDVLVMNVKPQSGAVLAGSAYDPQRKLNLSATVSISGDRMTTRGCVLAGMLCKSMNWTRVK
ncbi:MAG: DUF2147 domain-containing protein [Rhizobiales bacterium]|nr:DUF2147 domain-containing protein [Hyphomicrobiales bacterium]